MWLLRSRKSFCEGPILRPQESYQFCMCVCARMRACMRMPHDYILTFTVYSDDVGRKMCSLFTKYLEFFLSILLHTLLISHFVYLFS